ncbi:MAG: PAS domain-containing sensor histidine kinase [Pyrinomonadaceae bacterium]
MSESRFEQLMERVTDFAIIFKDADGIIEEWSIGAERLFGWTRDEAVGKSIQMIYTPDDRAKDISGQEMATALEKGVAGDDRWHMRKDGSFFFSSGLLHPIVQEGKRPGFVKIVRDLTDQIELQAEIDEARNSVEVNVVERESDLGELNKVLRMEMARRKRDDYLRLRLLQRVVETQEDERKRISRDIHDHLGQELTALRLRVEAMNSTLGDNRELHEHMAKLRELTEQIDSTVDFLAWELRPNAVTEVGLQESLHSFVDQWSRQFKVKAEFKALKLAQQRLQPVAEINLYRIAQESLNNIAKHADASNVSVLLERRDGNVALIIEDDGKGFEVAEKADRSKGLGLLGMGERAALLQGEVEIESSPGHGTTVHVRIPAHFHAAPQPGLAH